MEEIWLVHIGRVWLSARAHPGSPHALTKHKLVFDNLYANGVGSSVGCRAG